MQKIIHKINGKETFAKNWHTYVSKGALLDAMKICTKVKVGTGGLGSGLPQGKNYRGKN